MTDLEPLTETRLTETLDKRGDLEAARASGVYALLLDHPPDDPVTVAEQWADHSDVLPQNGFTERLADAERLVYIGSHARSMYDRLCQHANGEQSSTIMAVWPPVDVWGLYPDRDPETDEYATAVHIGEIDGICTWQDGVLRG